MVKLIGRSQTRCSLTLPSHSYRSRARDATAISAMPLTSSKKLNGRHVGSTLSKSGMPKTTSDTPLVPMSHKILVSHLSCGAAIMRVMPIKMAQEPMRRGATAK